MATDPTAAQVAEDSELRRRLGYGMLDVQGVSGVGFEDVLRYSHIREPGMNPRQMASRLRKLLNRTFTEKEAYAVWHEIAEYRRRRSAETGDDVALDQAARDWDSQYGYAFRRRWFLSQPEPGQRRFVPGARERWPTTASKAAGLVIPELKPLLEAGYSVTDLIAQVASAPLPSARIAVNRARKKARNKHYVRLIGRLTGWELSAEEAERVWDEALKHRESLSKRQGHQVPMERALVDYFKRLRLSGLDRASLWELGQSFAPNSGEVAPEGAPSTVSRPLFPA
ncbi:MAG: DUF4032 domain-containing protein [Chloroflexota bacterium]|nr:DUF4032 domain-containing protein [Chloroflexota bacterium]